MKSKKGLEMVTDLSSLLSGNPSPALTPSRWGPCLGTSATLEPQETGGEPPAPQQLHPQGTECCGEKRLPSS